MVICLPEFECFYCILEKFKKSISDIRKAKVTDSAALRAITMLLICKKKKKKITERSFQ